MLSMHYNKLILTNCLCITTVTVGMLYQLALPFRLIRGRYRLDRQLVREILLLVMISELYLIFCGNQPQGGERNISRVSHLLMHFVKFMYRITSRRCSRVHMCTLRMEGFRSTICCILWKLLTLQQPIKTKNDATYESVHNYNFGRPHVFVLLYLSNYSIDYNHIYYITLS